MAQHNAAVLPFAIRLFGMFDLRLHGEPVGRLRSRKGHLLLALLALKNGVAVERAWLAGMLWPDSDQDKAFGSLRQSLSDLRRALGDQAHRLDSPSAHTLRLDISGGSADVVAFDDAIRRSDTASLQTVVSLYQGPLLEDCADEWIVPERERREQQYLAALETLAARAREQGDWAAAEAFLRRVVVIEPLRETAQRALMRALASRGQYVAVVQTFRALRFHLRAQFNKNVEPDPETAALYQQLRTAARQRARQPAREIAPAFAPPPRSIPQPLTTLVGREAQIRDTQNSLSSARLVTLTGEGGIGKTRLAIQVAQETADEYPDGAWFVDLATLSGPSLVEQTVADVLGVREENGKPLTETLATFLRPKQLLLVLDNCEHLIEACALLANRLLQACSGLRVLATSRQALGITGEIVRRVPPLELPDAETRTGSTLAVARTEAVQLFAVRASAVQPDFAVTDDNAPVVARVCRQLDGIPLAIELAAARMSALTLDMIAQRLDACFRLLHVEDPTKPERYRTLEATIRWSYDLLSGAEQRLWRRLAVFAGGWTLEAAEAVCAGNNIEPNEILDGLTRLVEKSLVVFESKPEATGRYRLVETLRQYGVKLLQNQGEEETLRARHKNWFVALAEQAEPHLEGAEQALWLARLEQARDDERAVLAWALGRDAQAGLRLAAALGPFWNLKGDWAEGRVWLERALERATDVASPLLRSKAMNRAGTLAWLQGDYAAARAHHEQSLTIEQHLGNRQGTAAALNNLGNVARHQGDYGSARSYLEQGLAIQQALENKTGIAAALGNLGVIATDQGDYTAARCFHERSLAIQQETGNVMGVARSFHALGIVASDQGDYPAALRWFGQSLTLKRELGNKAGMAVTLNSLGLVASYQNDLVSARSFFDEGLALRRALGDKQGIASSLHNLGNVAFHQGDDASANVLFEQSLERRQELGDKQGVAGSLHNLGALALRRGDHAAAHALFQQSLELGRDLGDKPGIAGSLEAFARLAAARGQAEPAARWFGAAEALREALGTPLPPSERGDHQRHISDVCARLGEEAFAATFRAGQATSWKRCVADILEEGRCDCEQA